MSHSPLRLVMSTLAGLVLLGACVSVLPEQPRPEAVYRFAEPAGNLSLPSVLIVREPEASRLVAGRQIAAEGTNAGLKVVRGIAWTDRATRLFQLAMTDSFTGDGSGYAIDDTAGVSGEYELYWRITDFTLKENSGTCSLRLTLLDGGSRSPVLQWTTEASASASGTGAPARASALAEAGQACVAKAAERISSELSARAQDH